MDDNKLKQEVLARIEALEARMGNQPLTIRERIRRFSLAFGRPVNESYTPVSVEERELLGKLLLEECVEYVVKGLGCAVSVYQHPGDDGDNFMDVDHIEGVPLNPIEIADGLADVNVVVNFNSHWHGINLDRATAIVDDSNMSKLDDDGKAIINGVTPGYRNYHIQKDEPGFDPSKPKGKILKSANFYPPEAGLSQLLAEVGQNKE